MTLPKIPDDRDWSLETWRDGLNEAVRRQFCYPSWAEYTSGHNISDAALNATIAHATTLLDAGIVKPVVSEAAMLLEAAHEARKGTIDMLPIWQCPAAIAVIQAALDKARAGQ